jgi:hypothetical protein
MKHGKRAVIFAGSICASLLIIYALFYNGIEYVGHRETNDSIEVMVRKLIKIEYGWLNRRELENITTEDFRNNIEDWWFYKGIQPYMINDDFMNSLRKEGDNKIIVHVTIDGLDESYGQYYQYIIFDILPDGKYLISDVEDDA